MAQKLVFTEKDRERFDRFVYAEPSCGCWLWGGSLDEWGYGKFTTRKGGKSRWHGAHRISWMLHRGEITDDLWVLHRCDTPACVNPDHLWLGTHAENQFDKARKNRAKGNPRTLPRWVSRPSGKSKKYRARFRFLGKNLDFGSFNTAREAHAAARAAREVYFVR